MKKYLLITFLIASYALPQLAIATPNQGQVIQSKICGSGQPAPAYLTPEQLRNGLKGKDQLCADGKTRCGEGETCCGGAPGGSARSQCCNFTNAVCCSDSSGTYLGTCCPHGSTCSPDGSTCQLPAQK
jgi:hypothetical protein